MQIVRTIVWMLLRRRAAAVLVNQLEPGRGEDLGRAGARDKGPALVVIASCSVGADVADAPGSASGTTSAGSARSMNADARAAAMPPATRPPPSRLPEERAHDLPRRTGSAQP
jgi:hypothetical protein